MHSRFFFLTLVFCVSVLARPVLAGPEGTYMLDKKALGQQLEARLSKLPANRRAFVAMARKMFASLQMKLMLGKGGDARTLSEMNVFGRTKLQKGTGKWSQEGNVITIKTTVTAAKKSAFPQTIRCKVKGNRLTCVNPKQKRPGTLPFVKAGAAEIHPGKAAPAKAPADRRSAAPAPARRAAAPAGRPAPRR